MLIKCPECNKEISDYAEICIHCGYPIKKVSNNSVPDVSENTECPVCHNKNFEYDKVSGYIICKQCGCVVAENKAVHDQYVKKQKEIKNELNLPKCPTCGSTNLHKITSSERTASIVGFGLFSRKKDKTWKCNNCGSMW